VEAAPYCPHSLDPSASHPTNTPEGTLDLRLQEREPIIASFLRKRMPGRPRYPRVVRTTLLLNYLIICSSAFRLWMETSVECGILRFG